jgi:XapX domain-containing protein
LACQQSGKLCLRLTQPEQEALVTWQPYIISLAAGLRIGVIYGLIAVRSPAPPIIALIGVLPGKDGETGRSCRIGCDFHAVRTGSS